MKQPFYTHSIQFCLLTSFCVIKFIYKNIYKKMLLCYNLFDKHLENCIVYDIYRYFFINWIIFLCFNFSILCFSKVQLSHNFFFYAVVKRCKKMRSCVHILRSITQISNVTYRLFSKSSVMLQV